MHCRCCSEVLLLQLRVAKHWLWLLFVLHCIVLAAFWCCREVVALQQMAKHWLWLVWVKWRGSCRPPQASNSTSPLQHYYTVCSSVVLHTSYTTTRLHTSYTTLHTASCFPAIIWNADWAESVISLNTTGGISSGTVSSATTSGISGGTVQA